MTARPTSTRTSATRVSARPAPVQKKKKTMGAQEALDRIVEIIEGLSLNQSEEETLQKMLDQVMTISSENGKLEKDK